MKTKILILGAAITAFTFSTLANDALLTPRMRDNQPRVAASSANDPDLLAASRTTLMTPRAFGNKIKVVPGVHNDSNPALACVKNMKGTPRMVSECASHTTMPGCVAAAPRSIPSNWPEGSTLKDTAPSGATVAPLK